MNQLLQPARLKSRVEPRPVSVTKETSSVPLMALFAGIAVVASSSTSGYAPGLSDLRADFGTRNVGVVARPKDVKPLTATMLEEIKLIAGLTWHQLAHLFGVSPKTIHNWTAGREIRAKHFVAVEALFERVRALKGEPTFKVRSQILASDQEHGALPTADGPAILAADNQPFTHQQKVGRPSRTKALG